MTDMSPSVPQRPSVAFMLSHPAHCVALGFGSGLSPKAPGTSGTLWAWLAWLVLQNHLSIPAQGGLIAASLLMGWWACTVTAKNLERPKRLGAIKTRRHDDDISGRRNFC